MDMAQTDHCIHRVDPVIDVDLPAPEDPPVTQQYCCRCGDQRDQPQYAIAAPPEGHGPHYQPERRIEKAETVWGDDCK